MILFEYNFHRLFQYYKFNDMHRFENSVVSYQQKRFCLFFYSSFFLNQISRTDIKHLY